MLPLWRSIFLLPVLFTITHAALTLTPLTDDFNRITTDISTVSSKTTALTAILLTFQTDSVQLNHDLKSTIDTCNQSPSLPADQCANLLDYTNASLLPAVKEALNAILARKDVLYRYEEEICDELYKAYDWFGDLTDCFGGYVSNSGKCGDDVVGWANVEGVIMDYFGSWFGDFDCVVLV